jgi:hypothetical protein
VNTTVFTSKQNKLPLWFVVLLVVVTIFTLSSVFVYTYKHIQTNPVIDVQQSRFESRMQLLLLQRDVIETNWLRTLNPMVKKVEGRLIWSTTLQQGIMEFKNLPKINKNQNYRLWVYDLIETKFEPISAAVFNMVPANSFLIAFDPSAKVSAPFKFELALQTEGEELDQPLLLAQP